MATRPRDLVDVFQGKSAGYSYGRQVNPTVSALEAKINRMEGGVAPLCLSTGMAAIGTVGRRSGLGNRYRQYSPAGFYTPSWRLGLRRSVTLEPARRRFSRRRAGRYNAGP